ncbi:Crp/Fnr family transcriptional regulator [Thalassospira sp. MA62]|nr:Crp/Fnr family transcriptional regulator [Thalassospira sp. MA62]
MNKEDALHLLEKLADVTPLTLPSDATIGYHVEDRSFVYALECGLAIRCLYTENGERQVSRVYRPGDIIGLETLVVSDPGLMIETITPAIIKRIPIKRVHMAEENDPRVQSAILTLLAGEVLESQQLRINLGTGSAMRRICRFLLWAATHDQVAIPNRDKLGSIIATTTETASRMIAHLKRSGAITKDPLLPATFTINRTMLGSTAGEARQKSAA